VKSSIKEFIKTNLMVQSEFNLVFWFVSYNIFFIVKQVGSAQVRTLSPALSHGRLGSSVRHRLVLRYIWRTSDDSVRFTGQRCGLRSGKKLLQEAFTGADAGSLNL
jgi:hypothetical protein